MLDADYVTPLVAIYYDATPCRQRYCFADAMLMLRDYVIMLPPPFFVISPTPDAMMLMICYAAMLAVDAMLIFDMMPPAAAPLMPAPLRRFFMPLTCHDAACAIAAAMFRHDMPDTLPILRCYCLRCYAVTLYHHTKYAIAQETTALSSPPRKYAAYADMLAHTFCYATVAAESCRHAVYAMPALP